MLNLMVIVTPATIFLAAGMVVHVFGWMEIAGHIVVEVRNMLDMRKTAFATSVTRFHVGKQAFTYLLIQLVSAMDAAIIYMSMRM
jgi:hypothetical protein